MWDTVSQAELTLTLGQLGQDRAEMLRRHAEELAALDGNIEEIEALDRLIGRYKTKYDHVRPLSEISRAIAE
jgi:hypothetical protein